MKKIILFLSLILSGVYLANFIGAITITKNSGEVLDNSTWGNIAGLTDKIDVSSGDIKLNGKLYVTGKICDSNGICLGDKIGTESYPGLSCNDVLEKGGSIGNGVYWLKPDAKPAFEAYCIMDWNGGGYTIVGLGNEKETNHPESNNNIGNTPTSLTSSTPKFMFSEERIASIPGSNLWTYVGYGDTKALMYETGYKSSVGYNRYSNYFVKNVL
ncbi:MAG: fibrinogen-like YCDxxxxGGGW domain-containing protein [Candidatus Gracilibacteria bacterium]|nr:fibrinogen-like YCDxxxxGGGW domain-containing protein [Candidatus Gracilibacteria bacterium]